MEDIQFIPCKRRSPTQKRKKGKRKLGKAKNAKCHLSWNYHQMLPPIWSREIGKRWDAKWTPSDSLCDSSSSSSSSTSPVIMKMRTCQKIKHTLCLLPFTVFGIPSKVSFNIASEASYVYILSEHKFIKNAKNWVNLNSNETFWVIFKHYVLLLWFSKMLLNFNRRFVYKV